MKNIIKVIVAFLIVMSAVSTPVAAGNNNNNNHNNNHASNCQGMTGAVWATLSDYNRDTENFSIGQVVYVTGANLAQHNVPLVGFVNWSVTNQSAPGPNKPVIASGTANLIQNASLNPYESIYPNADPAYIDPVPMLTITSDLVGKDLRLNVWHPIWQERHCCNDFKVLKDSFHAIPEFPTLALPIAAILAIMFFMHKRKKEE